MTMNETIHFFLNDSNSSTIHVDSLIPKITLGFLLSSLALFTVFGNILVLYAIQTEKNLRTVSNLFILSLAFADLAVGLFVMPLSAASIVTGRWPFSSFICKMWLSIDYVASTASIFNLVLLSLDRYWAVVHPLRYLQKRTRRRATLFILTVWFISSLWAPAVIFWSQLVPQHSDIIEDNECDTSFRSNKTFKTLTALVNFYLPLLTMIIISCRIMIAIRSRSKMELGRRLSSTTQKQMKRNRLLRSSSGLREKSVVVEEENNDRRFSNGTFVVPSSLESPPNENEKTHQPNRSLIIERGQCFCSTCQTFNGQDNDSLWELQDHSNKPSPSILSRRSPFSHLKTFSALFSSSSSTTNTKDLKKQSIEDDGRISIDHQSTTGYSLSLSTDTKLGTGNDSIRDSQRRSSYKSRTVIRTPHLFRQTSLVSSFSDDYPESILTPIESKSEKFLAKKNAIVQSPVLSNNSSTSINHFRYPTKQIGVQTDYLKVPLKSGTNDSTITSIDKSPPNEIVVNPLTTRMTFSTFLSNLINPSRSSSLQKELKAARQLGILVGVFTVSWLPYFILFLVVAWCSHCVSNSIFTASIWLGYLNSTVNPLIYPLCNVHFRRAFQKICHCKHAKTKLPNLSALRDLHALHSMRRRRRRR